MPRFNVSNPKPLVAEVLPCLIGNRLVPAASSEVIARSFSQQHHTVRDAISTLMHKCPAEFTVANFKEESTGSGSSRKRIWLTEQAFMLHTQKYATPIDLGVKISFLGLFSALNISISAGLRGDSALALEPRGNVTLPEFVTKLQMTCPSVDLTWTIAFLRREGLLISRGEDRDTPSFKAEDLGLLTVEDRRRNNLDGTIDITRTTLITPAGFRHLSTKIMEEMSEDFSL